MAISDNLIILNILPQYSIGFAACQGSCHMNLLQAKRMNILLPSQSPAPGEGIPYFLSVLIFELISDSKKFFHLKLELPNLYTCDIKIYTKHISMSIVRSLPEEMVIRGKLQLSRFLRVI